MVIASCIFITNKNNPPMPKPSKIYKFFAKEWHDKWMQFLKANHPNFDKTKHDMRLFKICYTKEIKRENAILLFLLDTQHFWKNVGRYFIYNARYGIVRNNDKFIHMEWIYTRDSMDDFKTTFSQFIERVECKQTMSGWYISMSKELRNPEKYPDMVILNF